MDEAAYTARATTKAHVAAEIAELHLPTINNQFTHDDAVQFILGLYRVLRGTYNPASGQEMTDLLRSSTNHTNPSDIAGIRTTNSATIVTVLEASIKKTKKL
jgi:hypothetical protein